MHLAKVIGSIWATQKDLQALDANPKEQGRPIVALDSVGAGKDEIAMYITSSEAVITLNNKTALCDATIVGIVYNIEVYQ